MGDNDNGKNKEGKKVGDESSDDDDKDKCKGGGKGGDDSHADYHDDNTSKKEEDNILCQQIFVRQKNTMKKAVRKGVVDCVHHCFNTTLVLAVTTGFPLLRFLNKTIIEVVVVRI